jgi:hypothetical protein
LPPTRIEGADAALRKAGFALRLDADAAADPGRRHMLRVEPRVIVQQLFFRRVDVRKLQH